MKLCESTQAPVTAACDKHRSALKRCNPDSISCHPSTEYSLYLMNLQFFDIVEEIAYMSAEDLGEGMGSIPWDSWLPQN